MQKKKKKIRQQKKKKKKQKKQKKCVSQKLCLQPQKRRKLPAEELQNPDVNCDMFFVGIKNDLVSR